MKASSLKKSSLKKNPRWSSSNNGFKASIQLKETSQKKVSFHQYMTCYHVTGLYPLQDYLAYNRVKCDKTPKVVREDDLEKVKDFWNGHREWTVWAAWHVHKQENQELWKACGKPSKPSFRKIETLEVGPDASASGWLPENNIMDAHILFEILGKSRAVLNNDSSSLSWRKIGNGQWKANGLPAITPKNTNPLMQKINGEFQRHLKMDVLHLVYPKMKTSFLLDNPDFMDGHTVLKDGKLRMQMLLQKEMQRHQKQGMYDWVYEAHAKVVPSNHPFFKSAEEDQTDQQQTTIIGEDEATVPSVAPSPEQQPMPADNLSELGSQWIGGVRRSSRLQTQMGTVYVNGLRRSARLAATR